VQSQLSNPDLSIKKIAEMLRCSSRYLHRVFEDEGVSLERLIWLLRLEGSHAELIKPVKPQRSVAEVAFAWGFKSSAHFCRIFKQQYGVTPSECRFNANILHIARVPEAHDLITQSLHDEHKVSFSSELHMISQTNF
jgi:AraC-like DNA-binding protein